MKWSEETLGDLQVRGSIELQTGPFGTQLKASDYTDSGVPVINVRNIGYGGLKEDKLEFVPPDTSERLARHQLAENDIVFGRKGAVDRHLLVSSSQSGWIQGSDCIRLRVNDRSVHPRFLSYWFLREAHKEWMLTQCSNKATMASLNQDVIARISFRYPHESVQLGIVEVLSAYDDLIENNRRRIQLLEESARLLYREWFVHLRFPGNEHVRVTDGVPKGWEQKALGELCDDVRDAVSPSQVTPETPYIGLEHIPRRSITLSEWSTADQVESGKLRFAEGDMLFGKIRPYFHKVGFCLIDGITSSDAIVIRAHEKLHSNYLLMLVSSDGFVAMASKTAKEGSKMPRADWKFMKQQSVLVPPEPLLESFHQVIEGIVSQLKTLAMQNRKLAQARDLLLPRLMSGALPV